MGQDRWNIAAFRCNADVIVPPERVEGADWATARMNLARRGAEILVQRARRSPDTAAPNKSGKGPKRAREDDTPAAASGETCASTSTAKKAKQEEDPDTVAARLAAASAALELEDACKFQQLWLEGGTRESRAMTPTIVKMSNYLKALNFQLSALAKLELQFDGQLCELSAEEFSHAGFAEELSFDDLPVTIREHLDTTAGRLEKVQAAAADLARGFTTQCRYFWCKNDRPGCKWSMIEQIQHRRGADAGNNSMDDSIVPIGWWNDQVVSGHSYGQPCSVAPLQQGRQSDQQHLPQLRAAATDRSGRFCRIQNCRGVGNNGGQGGRRGRCCGRPGGRNNGRGGGRGGGLPVPLLGRSDSVCQSKPQRPPKAEPLGYQVPQQELPEQPRDGRRVKYIYWGAPTP